MTKKTEKIAEDLLNCLREHKYSKIDELWVKLLDDPPNSPKFYQEVAQRLERRQPKLMELMALACMQWTEQGRHRDALKVLSIIIPFTESPKELHDHLLTCVREVYKDRPNLERFLESSGLKFDTDIKESFSKLTLYLACDVDQVFQHATRGIGIVREIDEFEGFVKIDFFDGRPTRFPFDGVRQFLKRAPERHFLARKARDPEGMKKWAREEPAQFMKLLLKSMGGSIRQGDLKTLLTTRFFTPREWNSWWNKNRIAIRVDPYIEFRGAANVTVVLRDEPVSYHEECAEAFEQAESWTDRFTTLRMLSRVHDTQSTPEDVAQRLASAYDAAVANLPEDDYSGRLTAACMGEDLKAILGDKLPANGLPDVRQILLQCPDRQAAIQDMQLFEYQCFALKALMETTEDWAEIYSSMYVEAPLRLAQTLIKGLQDKGETMLATEAIESLFARPSFNPEVFVWSCRQILEDKWDSRTIDMPRIYLLICLLDFMEELGVRIAIEETPPPEVRAAHNKIRDILMDDGHENVCRVIREVSVEEARHLLYSIKSSKALSDTHILSIEMAMKNVRSDLEEPGAAATTDHYVTAESLRRMHEEYQRLKMVEIPANSRAIGEAAEKGDLRENADYDAAKERQKLLFARIEELHEQLAGARPLLPDAIRTDSINPGVRFEARNRTEGRDEAYTVLGMWDANVEAGVLSYQSPFAAQFLGKTPGDVFEVRLPSGEAREYEVLSVENALKSHETAAASSNA